MSIKYTLEQAIQEHKAEVEHFTKLKNEGVKTVKASCIISEMPDDEEIKITKVISFWQNRLEQLTKNPDVNPEDFNY